MKRARIFAVTMAAAVALATFSGCTSRNTNNNAASMPPVVDTTPDKNPDIVPDVDTTKPEVDNGMSTIEDDLGMNSDVSGDLDRDVSNPEINSIEGSDSSDMLSESVAPAMSADFSQIGALSAQKDTGFPGGPVDSQNRPSGPIAYQQKYSKYGAYFIVPDSKKIYLTFDEGYENGYTSRILDILKQKNVKAVFFITYPYAKTEPALVKRMSAEGHTIGNHSTKHLVFPDMPLTEAAKDLTNLHDYVVAQYGYEMTLFRPPEGAFSEQTLALAQALGYNTMLWSFAYKDYDVKNQPIAIEAQATISKKLHPGEICLLHAVSRTNAEILGEVIDTARSKGFSFADYFYFNPTKLEDSSASSSEESSSSH